MTRQERYNRLIAHFEQAMPSPMSELHYETPFQLLMAVMLSAQCTDQRVNLSTPALFAAYPDAAALAQASPNEVLPYIKSISYPNTKSRHLVAMAQKLVADFNGVVPSSPEALQSLPGVGRKTANVIASVIFNLPTLAVDTHVFRVANRIGLTHNSKSPLQTERTLTRYIPSDKIPRAHHWLLLHGRYTCTARAPHCSTCPINSLCQSVSS